MKKRLRRSARDAPSYKDLAKAWADVCAAYGVTPVPPDPNATVGVSLSLRNRDCYPIFGGRYPQTEAFSGWYIYAGKYSTADDFYRPLHLVHLVEWRPEILPLLGLPPGWRFGVNGDEIRVERDDGLIKG